MQASTSQLFFNWHIPPFYKYQKTLGSGAYGTVIQALDKNSHNIVAIKRIGNLFKNFEDTKRVYREISILRKIHDKNIITLHKVFFDTE